MNTTGNTRYAQLWKLIEITSTRNKWYWIIELWSEMVVYNTRTVFFTPSKETLRIVIYCPYKFWEAPIANNRNSQWNRSIYISTSAFLWKSNNILKKYDLQERQHFNILSKTLISSKLLYADNNDFRWKRMLFSCIFTRLILTDSDGKKVLHFSNFSESNSNCYCYEKKHLQEKAIKL